jgi:hypothetical protein
VKAILQSPMSWVSQRDVDSRQLDTLQFAVRTMSGRLGSTTTSRFLHPVHSHLTTAHVCVSCSYDATRATRTLGSTPTDPSTHWDQPLRPDYCKNTVLTTVVGSRVGSCCDLRTRGLRVDTARHFTVTDAPRAPRTWPNAHLSTSCVPSSVPA